MLWFRSISVTVVVLLFLLSSSHQLDSTLAFGRSSSSIMFGKHLYHVAVRQQQQQQQQYRRILTTVVERNNGGRMMGTTTTTTTTNTRMVTTTTGGEEDGGEGKKSKSVTGPIYTVKDGSSSSSSYPVVQLYTKEGCTLCDKVSDVLQEVRTEQPHSLEAVDITDSDKTEWWDQYKWDIPVLHINGMYWTKHKLSVQEAIQALEAAKNGTFQTQTGQPNAAEMERKQAQRQQQQQQQNQ